MLPKQFPALSCVFLVIILASLAVRLYGLSSVPLWYDEAVTFWNAKLDWHDLWGAIAAQESNPPLYYSVQKLGLMFGEEEATLRLPSAFFGVLSVYALYKLAKALAGEKVAVLAAALLALSAVQVSYSQEARTYTLLGFLLILALWACVRLLQLELNKNGNSQNSFDVTSYWLVYIACTIGGLYSHNTAIFFPFLTTILVVTLWITRQISIRFMLLWVPIHLGLLITYTWWLSVILWQMQVDAYPTGGGRNWFPQLSISYFIDSVLSAFASYESSRPPQYIILASLLTVAALAGAWALRKNSLALLLLSVVVVGVPLLTALIHPWEPILLPKTILWAGALFMIFVSAGLLALPTRWLRVSAISFVLLLQVYTVVEYHRNNSAPEGSSEAAEYVRAHVQPTDAIMFSDDLQDAAFRYYYRKDGLIRRYALDARPGQSSLAGLRPGHAAVVGRDIDAFIGKEQLKAIIDLHPNIWYFSSWPPETRDVHPWVLEYACIVKEVQFNGPIIRLLNNAQGLSCH